VVPVHLLKIQIRKVALFTSGGFGLGLAILVLVLIHLVLSTSLYLTRPMKGSPWNWVSTQGAKTLE